MIGLARPLPYILDLAQTARERSTQLTVPPCIVDEYPTRETKVDLTKSLYQELRKIAGQQMAGQPSPQTLQATALIHEAWLKTNPENKAGWNDRHHLVAAVALAMRHILVDRARRRKRARHGGNLHRVDLDAYNWERLDAAESAAHDETLLELNEVVDELCHFDPETGELLKLHYFAGLTIHEAAQSLALAHRTAERRIAFARAWIRHNLSN